MSGSSHGFTLVEVIVALAIVALVAIALSGGMSNASRGVAASAESRTALLLAQSLIERAGRETPFERGEARGTFANGAAWRTSMEPHGEASGNEPAARVPPRAWWITVEVQLPAPRHGARTITITTLKPVVTR